MTDLHHAHPQRYQADVLPEKIFRLAVEAAPNAMIMVDHAGTICLVNVQAERLFDYPRAALLGQPIELLLPERFRACHPGYREAFFATPASRPMGAGRDLFGRRQDGTEVSIEIGLNPLETAEGTFVLASIIDITERKRAEQALQRLSEQTEQAAEAERRKSRELAQTLCELHQVQAQLIQSEKLSSIGRLSAGIAHELSSPLQGLLGLLSVYQRRAKPDSVAAYQLAKMIDAAEHMTQILVDLTAFARPASGDVAEFDLREMVAATLGFSGMLHRNPRIRVTTHFGEPLPRLLGNKSQLQQVLLNLLNNASDAIPGTGEIAVRVEAAPPDVLVQVRDSGVGMPPEHVANIFEPFFTTKPPGQGTGLGMAVALGIIEAHHGQIAVESHVGSGTTVTVRLPLAAAGLST